MESLDQLKSSIESGHRHIRRTRDYRIDECPTSGNARPVLDKARQERITRHTARIRKELLSHETPTIGKGGVADGSCTYSD